MNKIQLQAALPSLLPILGILILAFLIFWAFEVKYETKRRFRAMRKRDKAKLEDLEAWSNSIIPE